AVSADALTHPVNYDSIVNTAINNAGFLLSEQQVLTLSNDTIYLTGGSYVKLPEGVSVPTSVSAFDNDAGYITFDTLQLSLVNDTLYLTNGSYVVLPTGAGLSGGTHNVYHVNACDYYIWHGTRYSTDGVYTYGYPDANGYYSVDTLELYIRHGTYNRIPVTATNSYVWHGTEYTATGIYEYHYDNTFGCASIDSLFLTINASGGSSCTAYRQAADTITIEACGSYVWYGSVVRQSGVQQHSLGRISAAGCDSVVRTNFVIFPRTVIDTTVRTTHVPFVWRGREYSYPGDYGDTMTDAQGCDSIYVLHFAVGGSYGIGAATGLFSVSNSKRVRFAHGNLQYLSMANAWNFAHEQYEYLGASVASSYSPSSGDLFCWGATGYHNPSDEGNIHYEPWDITNVSKTIGTAEYDLNQYGWGPSTDQAELDLVGENQFYDWGERHVIKNGGNGAGLWRLMTNDEWEYLLNVRPNAAQLRGYARITVPSGTSTKTVSGYLLLADDWECPMGLTFDYTKTSSSPNSYTLEKWKLLEASGAVFLPTGYYWSSTASGTGSARCFYSGLQGMGDYARSVPHSVRLVQEHQAGVSDCQCTYYDTSVVASGSYNFNGSNYNQSGTYYSTLVNTKGCDSVITLTLILAEDGKLPKPFSVSDTKKIYFSKGNLQYLASSNVWAFAARQYVAIGSANNQISATNRNWIDLFGWATSGYHDPSDGGNNYYYPYSSSSGSGYGPSAVMAEHNLLGVSAEYDWGVHNAIANGGNVRGRWRVPTRGECTYLVSSRPNAQNLKGYATVNGVKGWIILPDDWVLPSGLTFVAQTSYNSNVYSDSEWSRMEAAGAVFLPAAGYRNGTTVNNVGNSCMYWTSSVNGDSYAYYFYFSGCSNEFRNYGLSVRLVCE
ncbi:MAG: hypothetical protein KBT04_06245, partial [Bacteroidales bacterium]|nr:hypothetical protein [Candidatus Colimorpha onthohippi]